MAEHSQGPVRLDTVDGIARVTIDHPPMNLLDHTMFAALEDVTTHLEQDEDARVVILQSANPDYFVAHYDIEALLARTPSPAGEHAAPNRFHVLLERLRTLPKLTIGVVAGRARGAGSELLLALDLRFASRERAVLGQPEVALGILPGGTGTQRLPQLLGRARALEAIIGAHDFDADLAERYGWVNRALPDAELEPYVDTLARRVASYPPQAVTRAKRAVDATEPPLHESLAEENRLFTELLADPVASSRMRAFLDAGGQTPTGELDIAPLIAALPDR